MKILNFIFLLSFFLLSNLQAQNVDYSRVKISLENHSIHELASLGIEADHGHHHHDRKYIISDFSFREIQAIDDAGFSYEILIEDVVQHYIDQNKNSTQIDDLPFKTGQDCQTGTYDYETPSHFELGSMGGFFTYQEMEMHLDLMATEYPNLISQRQPISENLTHEDRPIYWLKISDNPNEDEAEPELLYNALTHAREPNGMSQLIYYMWYLLENYETDPEIQYLVDHTEMYFVPCVNPDGYIYNQEIAPNGGGLWRKNKRDNNEDGIFTQDEDGVDLNRNYGYNWGFDNAGSSPNPWSQVYRGPEAFSEPEVQNIRDFCNAHEFRIALNYHTYGNLLIYPWAYSDALADPAFRDIAKIINDENNFRAGTGSETVGYQVNGPVDDWMWGETSSKPAIYSFTPEVGPTEWGFWPPASEIIYLCQSTINQNLMSAHLVLNYGEVTDNSPDILPSLDGQIDFNFKRFGLSDGSLTVSLEGISANVITTGMPLEFNLDEFEDVPSSIEYSLDPDLLGGETVLFDFVISNGQYEWRQSIAKIFSDESEVLFTLDGTSVNGWTTINEGTNQNWNFTVEDFYTEPASITDSPNDDYAPETNSFITLNDPVNLVNAQAASLKFWCKWDIEHLRDYAQVRISTDGIEFTPLCGKYTVPGSVFQDYHQPVYQNTQEDWVQEQIDLTGYLGQQIWIQFVMSANDNNITGDGFYFDDLEIEAAYQGVVSTQNLEDIGFTLYQNRPNPAKDYTIIEFDQEQVELQDARLIVYDVLGTLVHQEILMDPYTARIILDTHDWTSGLYYYQIVIKDQATPTRLLEVVK